ncbi:MAG: hypothetical protein ACI9U2_004699, partial [Bradymonadia bacterium]
SGTQQSGTQQSGTQQSGTQQSGTQQSGTQQSGTQQSGTQQSGTQPPGARLDVRRVFVPVDEAGRGDLADAAAQVRSARVLAALIESAR